MRPAYTTRYIRFHAERCTACAECLKVCPTRAIRIRNRTSIRLVDLCIGCGACIRACAAGAISAATGPPQQIGNGHVAIALVSPVLYAQFPKAMPKDVLLGLRHMGFRHTIDMSIFLEMFQFAAAEFIRRNRENREVPWPLISPATFDRLYAPLKKEFFDMVHSFGAKVTHHCCGSSRKLIPRFIACGMDALQTIQPQAAGMDPYEGCSTGGFPGITLNRKKFRMITSSTVMMELITFRKRTRRMSLIWSQPSRREARPGHHEGHCNRRPLRDPDRSGDSLHVPCP